MLATARLKLRRFAPSDAKRVAEVCGDWNVSSMCRVVPSPYTEADADFFINTICTSLDSLVLAIERLADSVLIGCISLDEFRSGNDGGTVADLGYWLAADAWGLGYATEAGSAMVDYAFKTRGLSAIESGYWVENAASARVQSKLGFSLLHRATLRCAARGVELEQQCTRLTRDSWLERARAPRPPPKIVHELLSSSEVVEVEQYAKQMQFARRAAMHSAEERGDALPEASVEGWTRYGDAHEAIFLHYGGPTEPDGAWRTFAQACPGLFAQLVAKVREAADAAGICSASNFNSSMHVRCIEYHSYTAGGGLTEKNHCDAGSTVTLSVLLTEPTDGGVFSTTDADGITTQHSSIGRGDGIVLCSEMVHNVTPLRSGSRNSLVIEWWNRGMNRCDRFR